MTDKAHCIPSVSRNSDKGSSDKKHGLSVDAMCQALFNVGSR